MMDGMEMKRLTKELCELNDPKVGNLHEMDEFLERLTLL
jgi:hypothetical protein